MFKNGPINLLIAITTALLIPFQAVAATEFIYETQGGRRLTLQEFTQSLAGGDILVIGEQHARSGDLDSNEVQKRQVALLTDLSFTLFRRNQKLNVGMEFLEYPHQRIVDHYLKGTLNDDQFTKLVGWGSNPFPAYKEQIWASHFTLGKTIALNIPRTVTRQVGRGGLNSLSQEQRELLPPALEAGNSRYFERFKALMSGHVPEEKILDYFWAQSIWDDTMAWKALENWNETSVMAIIVGEFHVEYGGGLPDRLKVRGANAVKSLLQVPLTQVDESTVNEALKPDPTLGPRANYLWIYQEAP